MICGCGCVCVCVRGLGGAGVLGVCGFVGLRL